MNIEFSIGGKKYRADSEAGIDISIPMHFDGPQPNAYGVEPATARTCEYGDLIGDTRRGGSCNFEQYTLIPHCNGTHTECIGHITDERISVRDCLRDVFLPALFISVSPVRLADTDESYPNEAANEDPVITSSAIRSAFDSAVLQAGNVAALIVRTLPNSKDKLSRLYRDDIPPYFTTEALALIDELNICHLICDLPSIDRLHDGGHLANHRFFWKIGEGTNHAVPGSRKDRTVTELAYVPSEIPDGIYLLNLQVAPFSADAAPSRPILMKSTGHIE